MDWLIRAEPDLARWESRPFSPSVEEGPRPGDNRDNHERVIDQESPGPAEAVARRLADAILHFDVFPPSLLTSVVRRRPVEVGDTVGLRYPFVPDLHLFFAARVIDRFEGAVGPRWRCGFTYRTLEGHPECGEETFVVEKDLASGKVTVALRSWSRPGIWIARLTYPVMRALQVRAAHAALDHLQRLAHPQPPAFPSSPTGVRAFRAGRNLRTGLLRSDEPW